MQDYLRKLEITAAIFGNQSCLQHYLNRKRGLGPFARARKRKEKDNFSPPRTSLFFTTQTLWRGERSLIKLSALADKEGAPWEGEQRETTLYSSSLPALSFLFFFSKEGSYVSWSSTADSALSSPLERKPLAIFCRTKQLGTEVGTGWPISHFRRDKVPILRPKASCAFLVALPIIKSTQRESQIL